MSSPIAKRFLLSIPIVCLFCLLVPKLSQGSTELKGFKPFQKLQEQFQDPVKPSLINHPSNHQSQDVQNFHADALLKSGVINPVDTSHTTAPRALIGLTQCPRSPNQFTGHIRLPNLLYNISMSPRSARSKETRTFWNPTILALPYWAENQYLIVNMVTSHGEPYRRNVLCEANICNPQSQRANNSRERTCTDNDLEVLGPNGGLRCVTPPIEVDVPPTPAERCDGIEQLLADIPGFHDPRLFYSGRGEPILMVVSQSRYACIGLWAIDLRVPYPDIQEAFSSSPRRLGPGPLMSYPTLTELTRNPLRTRRSYEKNWVMFSPSPSTSYLQYELNSTTRTFAQLIGAGLTTTNETDPLEESCLSEPTPDEVDSGHFMAGASWHQATPALKLVLCTRTNSTCINNSEESVFFAAIHRKHVNGYGLPERYERYFVVWSATRPFNMLAVSQHPILLRNETNRGWTPEEIWDDVLEARSENRTYWGQFTYTTTIAYAWGREESDIREKNNGYLDDEVILSVGIDDQNGLYAKVKVSELLQCLKICPGRMPGW
ncbi:hypothetical protein L207DRAFT_637792 [Hyaloscypha variabilis F]|uniref:Uncharacterized protein n=1 Tax=Hyaloscypha variabilis (strain UAMH 11265 / GT02V1 / F) TaxID=1149755 RepID=A0A2J6RA92_HYAVF|nr:hypothetical protein L207DRAFT_637792 [Hyaloscypha variabilis F]